ncbi:hypothetical protein NDU88_003213 [Pleurodeles waltl]|uniref:Uncharacterized protein n=1 Tax=Pleurodeles waltl TaxID=8319 RepID=A0AAV7MRL9_PLEWA|nr:hypothetical protein NDU88_003213 [Pleurodeles waltl]
MHLGAEQQPPTAPATEAAHPAFPASRAVFRCCLQTPASGGGSKPCAGRAPRTRGEQPRREPPGTSVDQRRVSNSSLLLSRLVSAVHPIRTALVRPFRCGIQSEEFMTCDHKDIDGERIMVQLTRCWIRLTTPVELSTDVCVG